ncbi:bifunctional tRNA (adenosine(37)-N6)-threonylcarbamoyltransferase complex dimerization subunit type 1 TsaB/ribosomal-protein-alanine acetyltransferase RimI [Bordetella genomosp. 10]|uniref:[Ribosomal protein bS18]-alanine N-acetyltransferase n=1 Tax=Bordetella genomosp. 10 TaxID=1416804 RepID=A0A261SLL0_9BORD|nr:tRNA (adenosine(37)-N6)-threonylcarbamoyltransferase complex dimerization subunit type 1 TsaB [Bordetella genomosp. 10]OZI38306.1 bifunctional tRNA (adenosine(37)-N6)-threonylcarbamoyltransferase complex dimerization subunit type 1 TsaB/ribosomal-protein-alanine acetyltransferase RimI [Bordetella genomosp. 10]
MNLTLLALETSSSRCGVALLHGDPKNPRVLVQEHEGAQEHAERLLPMARELLAQAGLDVADLDAVAFGQGPGGFTGLRVACGVAQGIALARDIPVLPVVSHQAVAALVPARPDQALVVALDARMEEVYLAVYRRVDGAADDTRWDVLQPPMLIAAAEAVPWTEAQVAGWSGRCGAPLSVVIAGDAWDTLAEHMAPPADWPRFDATRPEARQVARLAAQAWRRGEAVAAELAAPLYVRDKVAFTTAERMQGQGGNPRAEPAAPSAQHLPPVPAGAVVELGPLHSDDLDEMARIEAAVQAFPWTRGNFADALASGYDTCGVRRAGRLLGFCILMHAPDVSHLLVIAVEKSLHGQGLGTQLMRWCEERAAARGIGGVLLEVRPSNTRALAFYERHGFLKIGVRRGYYPAGKGQREDAVVMQKRLAHDEEAGND